jgi:hypothetical protein
MRVLSVSMVVLAVAILGQSPARAADQSAIDPVTMAALQKMGTYLRSLAAFEVESQTTDEDVLPDGEKVQYASTATILARRPNRLRAELQSDLVHRLFLYDGLHFTLFADQLGYYATVDAPPTTAQLLDRLHAEHDLSVPLEDLFRWGSEGWSSSGITHASNIGPSEVNGTTCEQYIVREGDIDWQIWLQLGDYPLPRKLVITSRSDEARPEHTTILNWDLAPSYNEAAFVFTPPPGAERVVLPTLISSAPRTHATQ